MPHFPWDVRAQDYTLNKIFFNNIKGHSIHFKRASDGLVHIATCFLKMNKRQAVFCLPEFICKDVVEAIKSVGAGVIFFKIKQNFKEDLDDLKNKIIEHQCDFVMAVNYFGWPCDLAPIKNIIEGKNIFLIEDNAHGFLGRDELGEWFGLRADFGLFSPRKSFCIPYGGSLYSSEQSYLNTSNISLFHLSFCAKLNFILKIIMKYLITYLSCKRYYHVRNVATGIRQETLQLFSWVQFVNKWSFKKEIERRRKAFSEIKKLIATIGVFPLEQDIGSFIVPYGFAFLLTDQKKLEIIKKFLYQHDLDIFSWPELPLEVQVSSEHHYRNVYVLRFLW